MQEMSQELAEFFETGEGTQYMQGLQIVTFAMIMGVTMFVMLVVVVIQPSEGLTAESLAAAEEQARLFSGINIVLCFGAVIASMVLPRHMMRQGSGSPTASGAAGSLSASLNGIRTAHILCVAVLEGPALFGVLTVFLAKKGGLLVESPVYWVNLASTVPFYCWVAFTWPARSLIVAKVAAIEAESPPG